MGGRQKSEGDRQETGDRRQKTEDYRPYQEPGLGGRTTGWFQMMDGTKYSVSTVPRDCWQGFQLLSPFVCGGCAGGNAG
jgi:hypothetical protein